LGGGSGRWCRRPTGLGGRPRTRASPSAGGGRGHPGSDGGGDRGGRRATTGSRGGSSPRGEVVRHELLEGAALDGREGAVGDGPLAIAVARAPKVEGQAERDLLVGCGVRGEGGEIPQLGQAHVGAVQGRLPGGSGLGVGKAGAGVAVVGAWWGRGGGGDGNGGENGWGGGQSPVRSYPGQD
jgi:hypothetical protein